MQAIQVIAVKEIVLLNQIVQRKLIGIVILLQNALRQEPDLIGAAHIVLLQLAQNVIRQIFGIVILKSIAKTPMANGVPI